MSKRPDSEKEKFSPQYDCTMLTDLSVDSIFTPPSRGISPAQVTKEDQSFSPPPTQSDAADPPAVSSVKPPPPSLPAPPNPKSGSGSLARQAFFSRVSHNRFFAALGRFRRLESNQSNPLRPTPFFLVMLPSFEPPMIFPGPGPGLGDSKVWRILLSHTADTETTAGWLAYNRWKFLFQLHF